MAKQHKVDVIARRHKLFIWLYDFHGRLMEKFIRRRTHRNPQDEKLLTITSQEAMLPPVVHE